LDTSQQLLPFYFKELFSQIDDVDILAAIKKWQSSADIVLSKLCQMVINRSLLKIKIKDKPITQNQISKRHEKFKSLYQLSDEEMSYFVFTGTIENKAYDSNKQNIFVLKKNGKLVDVAKASDHLNLKMLSKTVTKYYICYPKASL